MSAPWSQSYDYATILINGKPMPVERVEIDELFTGGDESHVALGSGEPLVTEVQCEVEVPEDFQLRFLPLDTPFAPPTMQFHVRAHGGLLTIFAERAHVAGDVPSDTGVSFEMSALITRMLFEHDSGDKTAWDPRAVDVRFIVNVEGEP